MHSGLPASSHILAVGSDPHFVSEMQCHLHAAGHCVTFIQHDLDKLLHAVRQGCDLILMDVLRPGLDGLCMLQQLRGQSSVPVLLLSSQGNEQDLLAAFHLGADDYLPRPFSVAELIVRIQAILRRVAYERFHLSRESVPAELVLDDLQEDAFLAGHPAGLTTSEYRVLKLLWQHGGEVLSKPFLYQQALRRDYAQHDRSLDMHVSHLRRKLKTLGYRAARLETVWGKGYLLTLGPTV